MADTNNQAQPPADESAHQPGMVIAPSGPTQSAAPVTVMQPDVNAEPNSPIVEPAAAVNQIPAMTDPDDDGETVTWTASEFVAHHKTVGWYAALAGGTAVITLLVYLITKEIISSSVVIFGGTALGYYAGRQPRQLQYQLSNSDLNIGERHYALDGFRSYGMVPEGAFTSIVFMPLKRFAPPTTIYFAPEDEDRITALLSSCLPYEEYAHDFIDAFMRRIRF